MPLFMQIALGFSPSKSGMSLMPLTIGAAIITSQVSRIVKKFGYRNALITSSIFLAVGIFCFGFMGESVGLIMIIIMLILGMAVYMQFSAMTALALKNVENKFLSQSNSVISSATQISMALGVSFSATILERLSGGQSPHIQQFHTEFFIVAIFSLISSVIFLFINKDDGKDIKV
jgi:predicted MFS family arabinose efflux permease